MPDPLYRQIAEDIRRRIASGELRPGSQLPTELELREHYDNASRNTVRDAIRWLTNRGLVVSQPGRGTFVLERIRPFIVPLNPPGGDPSVAFKEVAAQQGAKARLSAPRVEVQNARDEVARELRIGKGEPVVLRHQQRFLDDVPSSLQTSFYPMEFVQRGAVDLLQATDIPMGATRYIEEQLGIQQTGSRDRLTVRQMNEGEITFFRLPNTGGVLVVVLHRTAYASDGKPMRFTATVYPSDRNHFVIDFGDVPPLSELVRSVSDDPRA